MRHKCFTFIGVDAMGECEALTDTGCRLSYEDRPKGGRMLIASEDHRCTQEYTREMMVEDWMPYQEQLKQIWKKYVSSFVFFKGRPQSGQIPSGACVSVKKDSQGTQ